MRAQQWGIVVVAVALAAAITSAQVGRGGSQWPTAQGDAQRTSWIRTDAKISVDAMSKPGFELQWKVKLDNAPRGGFGLSQGVSAGGVTLFIPMSIVTGSSNNVFALDNDTGYVVWKRRFESALPAPTADCPGGITSSATRIVKLDAAAAQAAGGINFGGGNAGYRSVIGEPGEGVPLEGRGGRGPAPGAPNAGAAGAARGAAAGTPAGTPAGAAPAAQTPAPPARGRINAPPAERIPGTPPQPETGGFGFLGRPSGVAYVIAADGVLHVVGLASGKDIQRPAEFVPANAKWSSPIGVNTMLYAATAGKCGGAPDAVWGIDLDSDTKPVVSWKTNGGSVVGAIAFTTDGTVIAAIGPGQATGDGKANAIVALDPKTLQVKDWFTQPDAEFVTGPTIVRQNNRDIIAAATKDGRVLLLDAASLGGPNHSAPLHASKPSAGGAVNGTALAAWQQANGPWWIVLPLKDGISALKLNASGDSVTLESGWASHDVRSASTPLIVNGVVFALSPGTQAAAAGAARPALHAYDGATGKSLWTSGTAMTGVASPGSLWSTLGQIYVGMRDGTLYAFGFNDERSPFAVK